MQVGPIRKLPSIALMRKTGRNRQKREPVQHRRTLAVAYMQEVGTGGL